MMPNVDVSSFGLDSLYARELKVMDALMRMEARGTRVFPNDVKFLQGIFTDYVAEQKRIANIEGGTGINLKSSKQLIDALFTKPKRKPITLTKKGNPSTDAHVLSVLAQQGVKLADAILEHNAALTQLSYLEQYDRYAVEESPGTLVIHPNFHQTGAVTGRISCREPNLMNVGSIDSRGKSRIRPRTRECFGPRDNSVWYLPDYSQIEVWVFAFLSGSKRLQSLLLAGHDFHGTIAEQVWGAKPDFKERHKYYRHIAKTLMFCKLYGGGVKRVAFVLGSSQLEAKAFVAQYDAALPEVKVFMDRVINTVHDNGMIKNAFGRPYYFPNLDDSYKATNYIVQGTAADAMKNAIVNVDSYLRKDWPNCQMLLTIHDELVIEVPMEDHSKQLMRGIVTEMQRGNSEPLGIPIPLKVGMKIAKRRWNETKEIEL